MYLNQIELNKKIDLLTNINQINNLILYIDYDVNKQMKQNKTRIFNVIGMRKW